MLRFLKQILVTLIIAMITTVAIYGGYTIYAADKYAFEDTTTSETMDLYREEMNTLFNDSLTQVVAILVKPEEGLQSPNLLQSPCVANDFAKDGGKETCENMCRDNPDNVSTYCVSVRAMDRYMKYIFHLGEIQGSVNFESIGLAEMRLTPLTDAVYRLTLARDSEIDAEIERSRRVLESTLTAYNEFMTAYPIHRQYQEVIKNLIKYKNKLKNIRDYVIQFPSTFIDTTSTKCS